MLKFGNKLTFEETQLERSDELSKLEVLDTKELKIRDEIISIKFFKDKNIKPHLYIDGLILTLEEFKKEVKRIKKETTHIHTNLNHKIPFSYGNPNLKHEIAESVLEYLKDENNNPYPTFKNDRSNAIENVSQDIVDVFKAYQESSEKLENHQKAFNFFKQAQPEKNENQEKITLSQEQVFFKELKNSNVINNSEKIIDGQKFKIKLLEDGISYIFTGDSAFTLKEFKKEIKRVKEEYQHSLDDKATIPFFMDHKIAQPLSDDLFNHLLNPKNSNLPEGVTLPMKDAHQHYLNTYKKLPKYQEALEFFKDFEENSKNIITRQNIPNQEFSRIMGKDGKMISVNPEDLKSPERDTFGKLTPRRFDDESGKFIKPELDLILDKAYFHPESEIAITDDFNPETFEEDFIKFPRKLTREILEKNYKPKSVITEKSQTLSGEDKTEIGKNIPITVFINGIEETFEVTVDPKDKKPKIIEALKASNPHDKSSENLGFPMDYSLEDFIETKPGYFKFIDEKNDNLDEVLKEKQTFHVINQKGEKTSFIVPEDKKNNLLESQKNSPFSVFGNLENFIFNAETRTFTEIKKPQLEVEETFSPVEKKVLFTADRVSNLLLVTLFGASLLAGYQGKENFKKITLPAWTKASDDIKNKFQNFLKALPKSDLTIAQEKNQDLSQQIIKLKASNNSNALAFANTEEDQLNKINHLHADLTYADEIIKSIQDSILSGATKENDYKYIKAFDQVIIRRLKLMKSQIRGLTDEKASFEKKLNQAQNSHADLLTKFNQLTESTVSKSSVEKNFNKLIALQKQKDSEINSLKAQVKTLKKNLTAAYTRPRTKRNISQNNQVYESASTSTFTFSSFFNNQEREIVVETQGRTLPKLNPRLNFSPNINPELDDDVKRILKNPDTTITTLMRELPKIKSIKNNFHTQTLFTIGEHRINLADIIKHKENNGISDSEEKRKTVLIILAEMKTLAKKK